MKNTISFTIIAMACFLIVIIALPASAVSITESPSHMQRGDPITITINGLKDGSQFSLGIEGRFSTIPGAESSFQTSNFYMPISLNEGTLSATTHGTQWTELSVKKGTTTVNLLQDAESNGVFSVSQSYSASNGTYTYLRLRGQARPDVSQISAELSLAGTKQGPENSEITFNVDGIDDGTVTVSVLVDGQQALYQTMIVGTGVTATPTTATPVPTTATPVPTTATPVPTTTAPTSIMTTNAAAPAWTVTSSVTTAAPTGTVTQATATPVNTLPVTGTRSSDGRAPIRTSSAHQQDQPGAPLTTTNQPTQSPSELLLLPIALAICCALVLRRK